MNRNQLQSELQRRAVPTWAYSLYGSDYDDSVVLQQLPNGRWSVYHFERGVKSNVREFDREDDACDNLLSRLRECGLYDPE